MKHSTPDGIKFKKLQRRLKLPRYATVGILESLWIATIKNAPAGDIGRFDNETIAIECDWDRDADELVDALTDCGWLDKCDKNRLVVHDWHDHAPYFVRGVVSKKGGFCSKVSEELKTGTIVGDISPPQTDVPVGDITDQQPNLTQHNLTKPKDDPLSLLPDSIKETVRNWIQYKLEKKKTYTQTGLKSFATQVNKFCASHGESAVVASFERSMSEGWQGWDHSLVNAKPQQPSNKITAMGSGRRTDIKLGATA